MNRDIDEALLTRIRETYARVRSEQAIKALQRNGFEAAYAATPEEAAQKVFELVPAGASVGVGGSMTARQLGLLRALAERGHKVVHHWLPGLTPAEARRLRLEESVCDVYLTSSNAITLDGKLVNVDGTGNRAGALMYGPGRVIIVAGYNKVVADVDEAVARIKAVAAPMNAIRYNYKTPCALTGVCNDCSSPDRLCRVTAIIERRPNSVRFNVLLVGAELGF
ncbi:MAG: lactate utilization protein [Bacillota bacterium]